MEKVTVFDFHLDPISKATAVFQMIQAERSLHLKKLEGFLWMVQFGMMNIHRSSDPSLQTSGAGTHFCGESF